MTERSAAAAAYARIQARIADVLAGLAPPSKPAPTALQAAEEAIVALLPDPVIVLPMPPTDPQMVAFVAQVAQSVAQQAAQTRAAHANTNPLTVGAIAS